MAGKRASGVLVGIILVAAAFPAGAQAPATASRSCDAVFEAFRRTQDVDGAIAGYQACLTQSPRTARYNLGVLYAGTQDWAHALEQFEEYLKLNPPADRIRQVQAEIALLKSLQQEYPTAEKIDQFRHDQLLNHSGLFLKAGLNEEAELLAARALQLSGGTYDDFMALAAAAAARKNFDVAAHRLEQAEAVAPAGKKAAVAALRATVKKEFTIATLQKSAEASLKTDPGRAGDLFSGAWNLAPERGDIGFAAAVAYLGSRAPERALPILDTLATNVDAALAARARKMNADLRELLARISAKQARESQVLVDLLKTTGKKSWTDLSDKDFARIETSLSASVARYPASLPIRHHYAFVLARQQKWPEAERQYQEILRLQPDAPVKFWLARVLYNEKKYAESQRVLNEDLQRGESGTPASAQLKTFLAEDVADAIKKGSQ